jgi:SOS response regulatory protein OraA/RecX
MEWRDLSDSELRARLIYRGFSEHDASDMVHRREEHDTNAVIEIVFNG